MNFRNEVNVAAPPDEVFAFVSDVERVAPCLPGAKLEGKDGDDYHGSMKVKVGPITAVYRGVLRFDELDEQSRRAVMRASAEETSGQGNAQARITSEVKGEGSESVITMTTDLEMRGKVAQFGRGAMEKISQRMFTEFAGNLEREMAAAGGGDGARSEADEGTARKSETAGHGDADRPAASSEPRPAATRPSPSARAADSDGDASFDALGLVMGPLATKARPLVVPVLVAYLIGYLSGRLRELSR